ncbi:translocation/assembly module TamB domain-containing protein [Sediminitomix flava]|uniref:translocation/assembly module TamB domain-containing protein n=1 Tax=Sediminitomix flava TaxID=379075 RepID=UPI0011B26016|nr:translocation/assembly module TamB domain-containing protein [Sediminitomix flava]
MINFVTEFLSEKTGYPTTIGEVNINWFDEMSLKQIHVYDTTDQREMISVREVIIDYKLRSLLSGTSILIDEVTLDSAHVVLNNREESNNINEWVFRMLGKEQVPTEEVIVEPDSVIKQAIPFIIEKVTLKNSHYENHLEGAPQMKQGLFNPGHLVFDNLNGSASNFKIASDTIALSVSKLNTVEVNSGLSINELDTDFMICQKSMHLNKLYASIGESVLRDSISFEYENYKSFSDFFNQVKIDAHLDRSIISLKDLKPFAEDFPYEEEVILSGDFRGLVSDFNFTDLEAKFGKHSVIQGEITLSGLPQVENSFMLFSFPSINVQGKDLAPFIPNVVHPYLEKFGTLDGDLTFAGFLSDFAVSGHLDTELGRVSPDLSYRPNGAILKGWLTTEQFDLGKLIEQEEQLGRANLELFVNGRGTDLSKMYYQGDLKASAFEVNKYIYDQATLSNLTFSKDYISGDFNLTDSLISVHLPFEGSLADTTVTLDLDLSAQNLADLNLMDDSLSVDTKLKFNWDGNWNESHLGKMYFSSLVLKRDTTELNLGEVTIESDARAKNGIKTIDIQSDVLNANFKGNFEYREYSTQINRLKDEFIMSLYPNDEQVETFYEEKKKDLLHNFFSMFDCKINDINKVLDFWNQDIYISKNTKLKGIFREDKEKMRLALRLDADSVSMFDMSYSNSKLLVNAQKKTFGYEFPLKVTLESEKQELLGGKTKDLSLNIEKKEREFKVTTDLNHAVRDDYFSSGTSVLFSRDSIDIAFNDLNFKLFDREWVQDSTMSNSVIYSHEKFSIQDISLNHKDESIKLSGGISNDPSDKLVFSIHNVDISTIGKIVDVDLSGILNVDLSVSDLLKVPLVNGSVKLFDTHAGNVHIGDIYAYSKWDSKSQAINLNASIEKLEEEILLVFGNIFPYKYDSDMFDLEAVLANTDLQLLEFFMEGVMSDIKGSALGLIKVQGNPNAPRFEGDAILDGMEFTVDYLKTTYKVLNDRIDFSNKGITFKNLSVADDYNNYGFLDGGILLNDGDWSLDMKARFRNFMLLNTQETDNELFYGQAFGTGNLHFRGPFNDLQFDITARSNKNTKVYIPIEDTGEISDSFIHFINPEVEEQVEEAAEEMGFKLNMNLDITPDAYCELIFDKATGDLIQGRGEGKLQIQMDTKGAFLMFGNVDIQEGVYNFNYSLNLGKDLNVNVLAKKFYIEPNSSIVWAGDPYEATMDITTSYEQVVNLANLVNTELFPEDEEGNKKTPIELRRKYPTKVKLMMTGQMLSPTISFDIDVYDYPKQIQLSETGEVVDLDMYVNYMKQKINSDEAALNAQVVNLMIFKQFVPLESNEAIENDNLAGNLSELISNQLSSLLSNLDENMQIDLNLGGFDSDDLQQMQLRFAYSFLGGRLKLIRDGGFVNEDNKADAASVLGDITLEMELTPQGNLRAKVYVKQNFNNFNDVTQGQTMTTQGFSIMHTKSFNSFSDFFKRKNTGASKRLKRMQRKAIREAKRNAKQKQQLASKQKENNLDTQALSN